jgi:hypothetical protein
MAENLYDIATEMMKRYKGAPPDTGETANEMMDIYRKKTIHPGAEPWKSVSWPAAPAPNIKAPEKSKRDFGKLLSTKAVANLWIPLIGLAETIASKGRSPGTGAMTQSNILQGVIERDEERGIQKQKLGVDEALRREAALKKQLEESGNAELVKLRKKHGDFETPEGKRAYKQWLATYRPKEAEAAETKRLYTTEKPKTIIPPEMLKGLSPKEMLKVQADPEKWLFEKESEKSGYAPKTEEEWADIEKRMQLAKKYPSFYAAGSFERAGDEMKFKQESAMADDFYKNSEPYRKVKEVYQNLKAANTENNNPMDDLFLIYNAVKMNDPNAVREGEIALVKEARSIPTQVKTLFNKASTGNTLTQEERNYIMNLAGRAYSEKAKSQQQLIGTYITRAKKRGLDPDMIIEPVEWYGTDVTKETKTPLSAGMIQQPAGETQHPVITTKEEFDKLNSGDFYREEPNGPLFKKVK